MGWRTFLMCVVVRVLRTCRVETGVRRDGFRLAGGHTFLGSVILLGLCSQHLLAQPVSKSESLTAAALQKRITSVQNDSEMPATVKANVVLYLQKAIERLEISQEELDKAEKFKQRLASATDAMRSVQRRLADLPSAVDPSIANVKDLDELERLVDSREKQLDDPEDGLHQQIKDLDAEAEQWRTRPEELTNLLSEIEDRLQEINDENEGLATSGEQKDLMQAHQLFLQSRRQRAEGERRAFQAESAWFQSTVANELLQAQQELAAKTLAFKSAELDLLQKELGIRRGNEADQRVRQAEAVVAKVSEELKAIATENLELTKEQREVNTKLSDVEHRHETTSMALVELDKEFDRTRSMVDNVGMTDAIGLLLRQQRAKLLDPRVIRSDLTHRNDTVRETRMKLFQLEMDCKALIDLDAAAAKRAEELNSTKGGKSVAAGLRALLVEQRQISKGLQADYSKYFTKLIEMDNDQRRLLDLTTKYAADRCPFQSAW